MILREHRHQIKAFILRQPEHQVHVLHGLTRSSFEQIVDYGYYQELSVMDQGPHESLVGVGHLLEVGAFGHIVGEGGFAVVIAVDAGYIAVGKVSGVSGHAYEDAAGEVAAHGDEREPCIACRQFGQRTAYLGEVLVGEWLVD